MAAGFEIEIKSLLGNKEKADALRDRFLLMFPDAHRASKNSQLNHYFQGGNYQKLRDKLQGLIPEDHQEAFENILTKGKNHSVRTRQLDSSIILVIKASIDDMSSSNGISRMEFEADFPNFTLEELDQILLDSDFTYQAKWSREREQYDSEEVTVCIDKNAGYGYVAEFEKLVSDVERAEEVRNELRSIMKQLVAEELPQERLERMFAYYNKHWSEYYGTDKFFVVE